VKANVKEFDKCNIINTINGMRKMTKIRLDAYLVDNGLAETRAKAQAIIMSGNVYINNQKADKSGTFLKETDVVEVRDSSLKYVSRGGLKLEKALEVFGIDITDKVCMDIGASTGGFTDCMLQNGASKVYAIDVGYGQMAWKIREDMRVINIERTNIRNVNPEDFTDVEFISIDVSFISLKLIFPIIKAIAPSLGCVCLIKPQFEAGRGKVGKGGIVREQQIHIEVISNVIEAIPEGLYAQNLDFSPICGMHGNIEYLLHISKEPKNIKINEVVENAHNSHYKKG